MDDLNVLYEFLVSLLPQAVVIKALTSVPIVSALVRLLTLIPSIRERKKVLAPLLVLIIAQPFGLAAVGFSRDQAMVGIGAGLVIALAAVGGFEVLKNYQQLRKSEPGQDQAA